MEGRKIAAELEAQSNDTVAIVSGIVWNPSQQWTLFPFANFPRGSNRKNLAVYRRLPDFATVSRSFSFFFTSFFDLAIFLSIFSFFFFFRKFLRSLDQVIVKKFQSLCGYNGICNWPMGNNSLNFIPFISFFFIFSPFAGRNRSKFESRSKRIWMWEFSLDEKLSQCWIKMAGNVYLRENVNFFDIGR